ncbi:MAG: NUDIX hydrolase [Steroidobacteraceae bacterium]
MSWRPDLTVAAVVQRDGRFLIVEEHIRQQILFNQPAGHVEDRESVIDAVVRETFEETAWHFVPRHLLGLYLWRNDGSGDTTLRVAICGEVTTRDPNARLDRGIIDAHWLRREELVARQSRLRSPLVLRCIDDYLAGARHDLSALSHILAPARPA